MQVLRSSTDLIYDHLWLSLPFALHAAESPVTDIIFPSPPKICFEVIILLMVINYWSYNYNI